MSDALKETMIGCLTAVIIVVAVFWSIAWGAVSISRADREKRSDAIEACQDIEDPNLLTQCIVAVD